MVQDGAPARTRTGMGRLSGATGYKSAALPLSYGGAIVTIVPIFGKGRRRRGKPWPSSLAYFLACRSGWSIPRWAELHDRLDERSRFLLHLRGEFGLLAAGGRSYCLTRERGSSQSLVFRRAICRENTRSNHVSSLGGMLFFLRYRSDNRARSCRLARKP